MHMNFFNDKDHWNNALKDKDWNIRFYAYEFFNDSIHWELALKDKDWNIYKMKLKNG